MAVINDKNNKDCNIKGEKISIGKSDPINKLLEKSGNGKIINPATKPIVMER